MPINERTNSSSRSSFDPTDETVNNSNNINVSRYESNESEGSDIGVKHFKYNPKTNKLEGERAIETTLNSLFLGDQHKMSSGSENIYFTNLTSQIDWYPLWGGVKDQSVLSNQDMSGVYNPTGRVFSEYGVLGLGGNPVNDTSVAYDGDNFFSFNISGMGITTRVAENVPSNTRLKYELSVNGTPVYVQILEHNGLSVNEDLTWFFDHPLDIAAGQTNHASITKIDSEENEIGLLLVCEGDDGNNRYQTNVVNRRFEDKNVAFTDDLESLDVEGFYDIYVDPTFSGTSTGTNLAPYTSMETAVNASNSGDKVFVKGIVNVSDEIEITHSLHFYGIDGTEIRYTSYNSSNANIFKFSGTGNTQEFTFKNIKFSNAGEYALKIVGAASVNITDCIFVNNGWSGNGLNTILSSGVSGIEGYDSDAADLQAFYAGANASNGGAMRIENATTVRVIGNTVTKNLRGIRVQDCGINGVGFITRNVSTQNIESGIYIAAGSLGGCHNITSAMNVSSYNANNGLLCIGGINNKFSQNEVNGNWNAGFCAWGAANSTLRDCGLYDNNRSEFNGIGNTGDARASIQINEAFNLLGTQISLNPNFRFIAEILDTQVHYTGLGSSVDKIGLLISDNVGNLPANDENIIKVDDVGFIGQDYAIDLSEVDTTNLKVVLGDNSYLSIGEKAVRNPLNGQYYELPFSNHFVNVNECDISVEGDSVILKEGIDGVRMNPYTIYDLKAELNGSSIKIMQKDSEKIQFLLDVSGVSINSTLLTGTNDEKVNEINALLQHTGSSAGQIPVITSSLAVSMLEGSTLNYELTADFAVAYEWDLSNVSGIATIDGNIRKLIGGSNLTAGTYNIPVKAINYDGVDTETLVLTVNSASGYSNSKSVWIQNLDFMAHTNVDGSSSVLPALNRVDSNNGTAWTVSMWIKPVNDSRGQTWFYSGMSNGSNNPFVEIKQVNTKRIRFRYGKTSNSKYIQLQTTNNVLTTASWNHIMITYDGGETVSASRYTRFKVFVNGSEIASLNTSGSSNGYGGAMSGETIRAGKGISGGQVREGKIDELAVFDSDKSADIAAIYNSGNPSDLASTATNWYRFGDGSNDTYPYIYDVKELTTPNDKRLTMNNSTSGNIVSDTP